MLSIDEPIDACLEVIWRIFLYSSNGLLPVMLRQACAYDKDKVAQLAECSTCIETLETLCTVYADRTVFGFCPPGEADWHTLTYQQFWQRVQAFAAGEAHACTCPCCCPHSCRPPSWPVRHWAIRDAEHLFVPYSVSTQI